MRAAVGVRNKVQPVADAIGAVRSVTIPGSSLLLLLSLNIQPLTVCADEMLHTIVDIIPTLSDQYRYVQSRIPTDMTIQG